VELYVPVAAAFAVSPDASLAFHKMLVAISDLPWAACRVQNMEARSGGRHRGFTARQKERHDILVSDYVLLAEQWATAYSVEEALWKSYSSGAMLKQFRAALAEVGLGQWAENVEILSATATFIGSWAYVQSKSLPLAALPRAAHALAAMSTLAMFAN